MKSVAEKLDKGTKAAVIDLLYRLGDDSLIIGHRDSEWTGIGPILEEDIAFSSMAQDKMGHALAYYNLLRDLEGTSPDLLAFGRRAEDFRCCSMVALCVFSSKNAKANLANNPVRDQLMESGDWAISFMRQFLIAEADTVRMGELKTSHYEPLAHVARKIWGEIKYHTLHGRTLLSRLGNATEDSRARLQSALNYLWPHALGMFEQNEHDVTLAEAGICATEEDLCARWLSAAKPLIDEAGLKTPDNVKPVFGGRRGKHQAELKTLLDEMQHVYRLDPSAEW